MLETSAPCARWPCAEFSLRCRTARRGARHTPFGRGTLWLRFRSSRKQLLQTVAQGSPKVGSKHARKTRLHRAPERLEAFRLHLLGHLRQELPLLAFDVPLDHL